ncbi:hypothetical protein SmJEL517_g04968 [Synchytrium microbalum]|uniref:Uncharacterized protein n=1 Tax=Synchytrium microbalum TaxID=1806994 RepID=A0A507C2R7_9FUNG|nr:uncharacterized protein SmJEL517_g04968 [Synchytrium microbalum]TPX31803.1 hypothetical protein SmJEL517_g04968 [Synchytrium microbalum]
MEAHTAQNKRRRKQSSPVQTVERLRRRLELAHYRVHNGFDKMTFPQVQVMFQRSEDIRKSFRKHYLNPDTLSAEVRRRSRQRTVSDMRGELDRLESSKLAHNALHPDDDWDSVLTHNGSNHLKSPGSTNLDRHSSHVHASSSSISSISLPTSTTTSQQATPTLSGVPLSDDTVEDTKPDNGNPNNVAVSSNTASAINNTTTALRTDDIAPAAETMNHPTNPNPIIPIKPTNIATSFASSQVWKLPGPKLESPQKLLPGVLLGQPPAPPPPLLHPFGFNGPFNPRAYPPPQSNGHPYMHNSNHHDDVSELMNTYIRGEQLEPSAMDYAINNNSNSNNAMQMNGGPKPNNLRPGAANNTLPINPFGGLPAVTNQADLAAAFSYFLSSGYLPSQFVNTSSNSNSNAAAAPVVVVNDGGSSNNVVVESKSNASQAETTA